MRLLSVLLVILCPFLVIGQTTTENYVKSTTYKQPYTEFQINQGGIVEDDKQESVAYFDGLGRKTQTISQRTGGDREDMVVPTHYDNYGRSLKSWLPMPIVTGSGNYYTPQTGVIDAEIKSYYYTKFPDDFNQQSGHVPDWDNPYSEKIVDDSPLGRTLETGAPGYDWWAGNGDDHTIKYEYGTNTSSLEVRKFSVDVSTSNPQLEYDGHYSVGALSKSIVKDEDWKTADGVYGTRLTYTDKLGRTILKRASVYDATRGPVPNYHDTYYIYDDFGNLTFVLSPEASDQIVVGSALASNASAIIDDLGYQYRYDYRNRITWKKVAGKGYEIIVYDVLDRPVLTQDALMRADDPSKFLFTKYDRYGRVAYTGIYDSPLTTAENRTQLTTQTYYYENQQTTSANIGGTNVYYTNQAFPSTNIETLTIQYYDTYVDHAGVVLPSTVLGQTRATDNKGQASVSRVKVLGLTDWTTSLVAYDQKGRVIYTSSKNDYLSSTDKVEMLLDFTGKTLESKSIHTKTGYPAITTWDYFYYDHAERLLTHKQQIDNEPLQLITENHYDDLGRMIQKHVGGQTALDGYTELVNVDVSFEGTAEKTNSQDLWNAGYKTKGEIVADGGVQYIIPQEDKILLAGLLNVSNTSSGWDRFNYAIYHGDSDTNFDGQKDVKIMHNDVLGIVVEGYQTGDVFEVTRDGQYIRFKKNGTVFHSILATAGENLIGKAGFYSGYGELDDFTLFGGDLDKTLQEVDYKYNVRGWLTDINEVRSQPLTSSETDLFRLKLNYNNVESNTTATALYNGNIAQGFWQTKNTDKKVRGYNYSYDDLNRLTEAKSLKGDFLTNVVPETIGHNVEDISYDLNGNLQGMTRKGSDINGVFADWDDLTYTYDSGNKLLKVDDATLGLQSDAGFKDGTHIGNDYDYDVNGNMNKDLNKGIFDISYNHLNLPTKINFNSQTDNPKIEYIYDAMGTKLAKIVTEEGAIGTFYAGNFIYHGANPSGATLKFFGQPEGYVEPVAGTTKETKGSSGGQTTYSSYEYVFQFTDHLGNVRLSYTDANLDGAINPNSEIIEENNYYPFGLKQGGYNNNVQGGSDLAQQWKFNGVERNESLGLNLYEMDLRQYDPSIARWTAVDPVTHHSMSTYTAFDNNPVFWADPSGADSEERQMKELREQYSGPFTQYRGGSAGGHTFGIGFAGAGLGWNASVNAGGGLGTSEEMSDSQEDDTYTVDKNGKIRKIDDKKHYDKDGNEVDKLIALDENNKQTKKSINVELGTLDGENDKSSNGTFFTYYYGTDNYRMNLLFNFLAYHTNVEWSILSTSKYSYLATSYSTDTEAGGASLLREFILEDSTTKFKFIHNHPNGSAYPSGLDGRDNRNGGNDTRLKNFYTKYYPGRVTWYIYTRQSTHNIKY